MSLNSSCRRATFTRMDLIGVGSLRLCYFVISTIIAIQSRRRSYAGMVRLLAGSMVNPCYLLVLLAVLPDYAEKARRHERAGEQQAEPVRTPPQRVATARLATLPTTISEADASIGSRVTGPADASMGDDVTHLASVCPRDNN